MIQKRYEYWSGQGKTWSDWFDYDSNDNNLSAIQANEQYQFGKKLRNGFRVVNK
jgi:hypothetical protein